MNPKIETLVSNFENQNLFTGWEPGSTYVENNMAKLSGSYSYLETESQYDLTDSRILFQVPVIGDNTSRGCYMTIIGAQFTAQLVSDFGNAVTIRSGGSSSPYTPISFSDGDWIRLSHSSASNEATFEISADGIDWTTALSYPISPVSDITSVTFSMEAFDYGSPYTVAIARLNIPRVRPSAGSFMPFLT